MEKKKTRSKTKRWDLNYEFINEGKTKCDLCDYEVIHDVLKFFNGRWLCNQCYIGEVENPELQLEGEN